jgi:nitroimidazol reductase NimA-like FMN-containing flavoprotein (pyridoxamine 5'-phosphate oxidase superfamily)
MTDPAHPRFRTLDHDECVAILSRNHVGRLAYARHGRVDIEPLNYVYHEGWLYGRTSHGAKIDATGTTWAPVAFEVDEVEELFRWRSVVVHGGFYSLEDGGAEVLRDDRRRGVELLRTLVPDTFTGADPVAFRTVVFRIAVQEVAGREAVPGDAPAPAAAGEQGRLSWSGSRGARRPPAQEVDGVPHSQQARLAAAIVAAEPHTRRTE